MKFENDTEALNFLLDKCGYKMRNFILYHPDNNHKESTDECSAINYLCQEWDYGWSKSEYIN